MGKWIKDYSKNQFNAICTHIQQRADFLSDSTSKPSTKSIHIGISRLIIKGKREFKGHDHDTDVFFSFRISIQMPNYQ